MPPDKERSTPSPGSYDWDFRFGTNKAKKGWDQICLAAPSNARQAWYQIIADPRRRNQRQHPLKGSLAERMVNGRELEQWQYEVTCGGRIWYCIDDPDRSLWMTHCSVGHPKETD